MVPLPVVAVVEVVQRRRGIRVRPWSSHRGATATDDRPSTPTCRLLADVARDGPRHLARIRVVFWGASLIALNTAPNARPPAAAAFLIDAGGRLTLSAGIGTGLAAAAPPVRSSRSSSVR
jgi:hypothetical protein